jgi:hypothetical protein
MSTGLRGHPLRRRSSCAYRTGRWNPMRLSMHDLFRVFVFNIVNLVSASLIGCSSFCQSTVPGIAFFCFGSLSFSRRNSLLILCSEAVFVAAAVVVVRRLSTLIFLRNNVKPRHFYGSCCLVVVLAALDDDG